MISSKLHNYFAGKCNEEEILSIKEWVESSEENQQIFDQERVLFDILTLHNSDLNIEKVKKHRSIKNIYLTFAKIACILIVLLLTTYFSIEYTYDKLSNSIQQVHVPAGQYINIQLPDGSNVWLNSQTSLEYSPVFCHNKRHVKVEGEAYFKVAKNENIPFEVETSEGVIRVLGTEFNVKTDNEMNEFCTSLINGSVEINLKNNPQKIILTPGYSANMKNNALVVSPIENYNDFSWKDGLITFDDASFDMIMNKFEDVFGYKIILLSENVNQTKYTGKFRINDGIDYALRVLRRSYSFEIERIEDQNLIYIKPID